MGKEEEKKREKKSTNRAQTQVRAAFPTVGIGASAGGLQALQDFFSELPPDTGAAYVVIVHLDPTHSSEMADILSRRTKMPVHEVNRKVPLEPNKVYVIPPNRRLLISEQDIATFAFEEPRGKRAPIDQFFRSLADQHGDGYAVILTGAGLDGTLGVKAIKEADGLILVQDPEEAEYPSMPRNAIATGMADIVLPVRELAQQLAEFIRSKHRVPAEDIIKGDEELFRRVLTYLRTKTGHDFSRYKRSTITRRIARRMQVTKVDDLQEYFDILRGKGDEPQQLFNDLLISVTTFFRDPSAFQALAELVIPKLFAQEDLDTPLRIWVPGCATGEEAYSIAMLLADEAARHDTRPEIQIFASDLDQHALTIACEGCYPTAIETGVSEERLRKYFTREGDQYRIKREIRDMVLFANHSLLRDPPFSRIDLISCRNVLIYMERELQAQVLSTFHYALKPGCFLFLGPSETADNPTGLFRIVHRDARIYQTSYANQKLRELPRLLVTAKPGQIPSFDSFTSVPTPSHFVLHQRLLETAAPPSVLVNPNNHVVNISESAGRFMQPSGGALRNDITELVRPELRFDLRAGLMRAFERNESSISLPIPVQFNGTPRMVLIQMRPVRRNGDENRQALVFFLEGEAITPEESEKVPEGVDNHADAIIRRLKEELELTRARLRASREDYEGADEELRAANEELQSINEEYRSTAEELETSKEELQSINEEIQTVNAELKLKLESVSRANNDLQNLMAATDVGTLFLDSSLKIKRFTPRIAELFNITPADEGRSISDFTHRLDYPNFMQEARSVLANLGIVEREVASEGRWYLTRLRPYRTLDNRIEGVVCTFVDITERLRAQEALKRSEALLRLLLGELSHRVKNTLTVVQSMARQSFRDEIPRAEALQRFSDRLGALSIAHDLLVASDWTGASLSELVRRQLSAFVGVRKDRIHYMGPDITLPPDTATRFGLILHELGTNALKYGSLSSANGAVELSWELVSDNGDERLKVEWVERGGPQPVNNGKAGFGTFLIEQGLAGAQVERRLRSSGLECSIALPLPKGTAQKD